MKIKYKESVEVEKEFELKIPSFYIFTTENKYRFQNSSSIRIECFGFINENEVIEVSNKIKKYLIKDVPYIFNDIIESQEITKDDFLKMISEKIRIMEYENNKMLELVKNVDYKYSGLIKTNNFLNQFHTTLV